MAMRDCVCAGVVGSTERPIYYTGVYVSTRVSLGVLLQVQFSRICEVTVLRTLQDGEENEVVYNNKLH